jgi:hypothetical protein
MCARRQWQKIGFVQHDNKNGMTIAVVVMVVVVGVVVVVDDDDEADEE